ncbi:MAG TPA: glutamate--tRNA ligase [Methanomassiliicoccales archaeon]|nr:glutamate--tRNA ligase [Methanomassiliicoccales archaeon]
MAEDAEQIIRKYALQNAVLYKGKANPKAVVGKVLAETPELRSRAKELMSLIQDIVGEINSMPHEDQIKALEKIDASLLVKQKGERASRLPDLPGAEKGKVVMRFAPGPSGPLHIGHSRVAILNDEYVKRYNGKFINRMEDTNPDKIDPEAYHMIPEDLEWLGVDVNETVIQSDRFDLYYQVMKELLELGNAYVCFCQADDWRSLKEKSRACPHRDLPIQDQLESYDRILAGDYSEGEAVVVIKTDLFHPNPAIRDFIALRIVDTPHPRTGDRYHAYPMMNLSVAVDDHTLGLTHVLRGKDHLNNTLRQEYIFNYLGWKMPWYHHYGFVSIPEAILKTSVVREGIKSGEFTGWDDVRLGTFRSLRRRGIQPDAIRAYWVDVGMKDVDIQFSWENLYAFNKEIVDPEANRYFFVWDPVRIEIEGVSALLSKAPLHPDYPERGARITELCGDPIEVLLTPEDHALLVKNGKVRLKDLCNLEYVNGKARYIGNDLSIIKEGARIVHWNMVDGPIGEVLMPDGTIKNGVSESIPDREIGKVVQFERFGFCMIEQTSPIVKAVYSHR